MDDIVKENLMKLMSTSNDDVQTILDDKARAEYLLAIAKIREAEVKEKELEMQAKSKDFENQFKEKELKAEKRKNAGELVCKILDISLKFAGTAAAVIIPAGLYKQCWDEGMQFEKEGIITSSKFKDHIRSLKLKFW